MALQDPTGQAVVAMSSSGAHVEVHLHLVANEPPQTIARVGSKATMPKLLVWL